MKPLTTEQLEKMIESGEQFELINVLPPDQFEEQHIAGSVNIPVADDNFVERVQQQAGGKDKPIVVYCASEACDASPKAAKKLEDAGFTNVYDYEGGTKAWYVAGLATTQS